MTRLVEALHGLGLNGEVGVAGRWIRVQGERCAVYVVETVSGGYYTWCDAPDARSVQSYRDPAEAIYAGLQRAGGGKEV